MAHDDGDQHEKPPAGPGAALPLLAEPQVLDRLDAASWALVVPFPCMCRRAARAYIAAVVGPNGCSNAASGACAEARARAIRCDLGSRASVMRATRHFPAAMAGLRDRTRTR